MPTPGDMKCRRCGARPYRGYSNWNGVYVAGRLVAIHCPKCQTPQENEMAVA